MSAFHSLGISEAPPAVGYGLGHDWRVLAPFLSTEAGRALDREFPIQGLPLRPSRGLARPLLRGHPATPCGMGLGLDRLERVWEHPARDEEADDLSVRKVR